MMNQDDYDLVTMSKRQWREERSRYAKTHRDAAIELRRALELVYDMGWGDDPDVWAIASKAINDTEWLKDKDED